MKSAVLLALMGLAAGYDHGSTYGGSGPYKSYYFEEESLVNHTFYQPLESALEASGSDLKLPVIVWGNGACDACVPSTTPRHEAASLAQRPSRLTQLHQGGLKFRGFLGEVASWGALAIATGPAFVDPESWAAENPESGNDDEEPPTDGDALTDENPDALTAAIDWVYANAGQGRWRHVDRSRIGVWGQSCGGLEAYAAGAQDERVSHLGIFNSGQLSANASAAVAGKIHKPVFYTLGGPDDVAYANGELDYANLPAKTPAWKGNHDLGHSAAFDELNAGIPGATGRHILQWILRGDESAKSWFTGKGANETGFKDVVYKNLDSIEVTPIQ